MERVKLVFPHEAVFHRHPMTVRVTDMNYGHHLGHDALVSLLHEARIQALASLGLNEWDMHGYPSVVADLAVQYQSEARWPDSLSVETAIPTPESKALSIYHRVVKSAGDKSDGEVVATARVNQLLVDTQTGRPVTIPETVLAALAEAEKT
ncbi:thioesterase family protein [Halomonas sediminis]